MLLFEEFNNNLQSILNTLIRFSIIPGYFHKNYTDEKAMIEDLEDIVMDSRRLLGGRKLEIMSELKTNKTLKM